MNRKRGFVLLLWCLLAPVPGAIMAQEQEKSPPPTFQLEGNELITPAPVLFKPGSDQLDEESEAALEHVKAYLEAKGYITLMRIEAHTDNSGDSADAQTLTEKRALAVAKWLADRGIDCKRLLPVGFGSSKPAAENSTPEGKARNRRVSFINAALRGKPIGRMPVEGGGIVAGDPCVAPEE